MWSHTATHPQTQCRHIGVHGEENQGTISIRLKESVSQAHSHLQCPSASLGPVALLVGVLILPPCSTVKELCSPDAKCRKIFSDPIHKGTGRQALDKTGFGGKYSPPCFTETFVPWSRSGVNRNSETSDLKAGYQGMFCMGPVHVQHAYF